MTTQDNIKFEILNRSHFKCILVLKKREIFKSDYLLQNGESFYQPLLKNILPNLDLVICISE